MIKKAGTILMICCFILAALPNTAPAAQSISKQSLVKKNISILKSKLEAAAADDTTAIHALTVQFLEDLLQYGFKKDPEALQLAVDKYVADVQDQAAAAETDLTCLAPLVYSIYVNSSSMAAVVTSAEPPVCMAISLSSNAASIISAKYSWDVCKDPTLAQDRATKQVAIRYFTFATSVMDVFICNPTAGVQTYLGLLYNFFMLFMASA